MLSETDSDALVALLPHRPPFRFIDRVDEHVPGESVIARYRVTGDEPFLAGHFPGNPVFPGVLQLESIAQAGAIAILADPRTGDRIPLFGGGRGRPVPADRAARATSSCSRWSSSGSARGAVGDGAPRPSTATSAAGVA